MRGGHDGARPDSRECGAIGKSLSYPTWPELSEEPLSTIGCLQPPACANLACVAGPDPATPATVYHLRGSDSHTVSKHPCRPSLTSLTTSSVPSFISCVRQLVQNITKARNIEISFDNLILV